MDVPTEEFEPTAHGILLSGCTVIPWHRGVIATPARRRRRSTRPPAVRPRCGSGSTYGTEGGERLRVRADRFEQGQWTIDLVVERALNVEAGIFHVTEIHVPWSRVLEYERLPMPVDAPSAPTDGLRVRPSPRSAGGSFSTVRRVDIAFIAGGNPAIVAVCRMISRSSSAVRPAFSEARRCWGICDDRPVATSAATAAISRSRSERSGRVYTSPYANSTIAARDPPAPRPLSARSSCTSRNRPPRSYLSSLNRSSRSLTA